MAKKFSFTVAALVAALIALAALAFSAASCRRPLPVEMVLPSPAQVEWQRMEFYMFVHFGPNTFTDVEWGDGSENPDVFNPTDLDCHQWARIARDAGMKGIILTAKHHDGFCLWPSEQSTHTVRESSWRGGKGDVLRELSDACRRYGLRFGVYISPWDRNHPAYGTPEYNEVFAATLREVLTGYGEVFEQWLDGANGEGPDGRRQEYDWALFHNTIRECQPNAVIFSDVGPDCRWIGNERGVAGETNWSRLHTEGFTPGLGAPAADSLNRGNVHGATWVPGEADVSIRPGWFYSPSTDDKVKSVEELMSIYLSSVGRNANLLLNVPPDRTGRINAVDSARLMEFRAAREAAFGIDLAAAENGATVERSDDAIVVSLPSPATVNYIALGEDITQGQRIARFEVSYMNEASGEWLPLTGGTTIGHKRILHVDPVTVKRVRIEIESSLAPPVISTVSLY